MSSNISLSTQIQTSKAILSATNWSVLDFDDIEKSLAAKLSDDHIDKILRGIDAVNNLHILKLAGCVNILGTGLDMLRSSMAIQQIDLSLVGKHESSLVEPEPLLSESVVLPILDDIISRGSSLKKLELPKKWRNEQSTQMTQFLVRYSIYLLSQRNVCSACDQICTGLCTCTQCLNHFCHREDCTDEEGDRYTHRCMKCEKEHCKSCSVTYRCDNFFCNGMNPKKFCSDCSNMRECEGEGCSATICGDCMQSL